MKMERHVLVLFPHPDDETLAVGGTIAVHGHAGVPVTYACFTLGQMGRNMGKPFFANRETLPTIREQELREACIHLGISELRLMGFRDKTLEFEDPDQLADIIVNLILELKPSLIVTYYPNYCVHPDHEAIAHATVAALRRLEPADRPRLICQAFSNDHAEALGDRDVHYDTRDVAEHVYQAMKAHKSQTASWLNNMEEARANNSEEWQALTQRLSEQSLYTYPV